MFIDKNGNGKQDPGEAGVPDFLMQILNRTNNPEEGGQNVAYTNNDGFYQIKEGYPLGNDLVLRHSIAAPTIKIAKLTIAGS